MTVASVKQVTSRGQEFQRATDGYSTSQLAELMGVSIQMICRYRQMGAPRERLETFQRRVDELDRERRREEFLKLTQAMTPAYVAQILGVSVQMIGRYRREGISETKLDLLRQRLREKAQERRQCLSRATEDACED